MLQILTVHENTSALEINDVIRKQGGTLLRVTFTKAKRKAQTMVDLTTGERGKAAPKAGAKSYYISGAEVVCPTSIKVFRNKVFS